MQLEEIPIDKRYEYNKVCPCCEKEHIVLTKESDFPEYETEVYIQCECGEWIEFVLPVN